MRGFRRTQDPRVTALLSSSSRERILAWGELSDDSVVVCTDLAIHYPPPQNVIQDQPDVRRARRDHPDVVPDQPDVVQDQPDDPTAPGATRVPWDLVVRGAWSEEFLDLVVQSHPGGPTRQVRLRFSAPGNVPAVVKERVQWTVVASQSVELTHPSGRSGSAMLNARRSPATGEVRWAVVFGQGIDAADPAWRAAADAVLADLRSQLGV